MPRQLVLATISQIKILCFYVLCRVYDIVILFFCFLFFAMGILLVTVAILTSLWNISDWISLNHAQFDVYQSAHALWILLFCHWIKEERQRKSAHAVHKRNEQKGKSKKSCGWGSCWSAIEYFRSMCVVVVALKRKLVSNCIVFFLPLQLLRRVHSLFSFSFALAREFFFTSIVLYFLCAVFSRVVPPIGVELKTSFAHDNSCSVR